MASDGDAEKSWSGPSVAGQAGLSGVLVGWQPSVPLEEGVRRAIEYYREHGISQTYTHLKVGE